MSVCGSICVNKCWGHLFKLPEIGPRIFEAKTSLRPDSFDSGRSGSQRQVRWQYGPEPTEKQLRWTDNKQLMLDNGSHVTVHNSAWQIGMLGDVAATQQFRMIFEDGNKRVSETEAESQLPSQSVGKDFGKAKGLVTLTFRHGYKLQMRNEVKWFLSQILWCIFRLNCTYMTYDTWFMIYNDTGCMIGDKYVLYIHSNPDRCSIEKTWMFIYIYGCALHVPGPPPPPPTPMVWSPTVLAATVVVLVLVLPSTSTT